MKLIYLIFISFCFSQTHIHPDSIEQRIFFLGDAGTHIPENGFMPNLVALKSELHKNPSKNLLLILGDNIYPAGLPPEEDESYETYRRILQAQIDISTETGVKTYMIPGNHGWNKYSEGGWDYIIRMQRYVDGHGKGIIEFYPKDGTPGPVIKEFGSFKFILMDTHWFLHQYEKPFQERETIVTDSIFTSLEKLIQTTKDKHVIIAAHHPIRTNGVHGGYFNLQDHLFPLTRLSKYAWVPLPLIGSIYPIARNLGASEQDVSGTKYSRLITRFNDLLDKVTPLAIVGGHEHNLQVLEHKNTLQLISGSGRADHITSIDGSENMLYGVEEAGFIVLNKLKNKQIVLEVWISDKNGRASLVYQNEVKVSN